MKPSREKRSKPFKLYSLAGLTLGSVAFSTVERDQFYSTKETIHWAQSLRHPENSTPEESFKVIDSHTRWQCSLSPLLSCSKAAGPRCGLECEGGNEAQDRFWKSWQATSWICFLTHLNGQEFNILVQSKSTCLPSNRFRPSDGLLKYWMHTSMRCFKFRTTCNQSEVQQSKKLLKFRK